MGFIRAFRGKDENAHAVIDTYMELLCEAVANKRGHIPTQTAKALT